MADKYLPHLKELTSLQDDDLFYIVSDGDYKSYLKEMRKYFNPSYVTIPKTFSYNITVDESYGNWFSNEGAFAAISFKLPIISDGMYVCFVVQTAKNMLITPQASDLIMGFSTYGGQSIKSSTIGDTVVLRATSNNWHISRIFGSWSV